MKVPSSSSAEPGAAWTEVPESLNNARKLKALSKTFADHLYQTARMILLGNVALGLNGEPGEDVVAFRERCRRAAHQEAEKALAAQKLKYEPRFQELGVPIPEGHVRGEESLLASINPLNWFRAAPTLDNQGKINQLHSEWLSNQAEIVAHWKQAGEEYVENPLAPRRQDVQVTQFGLAWAPFWLIDSSGRVEQAPAWR
jgi:hypothetical protein